MTTPRPNRAALIRTIASSLAFDADPPYVRSLDKARAAAAGIVDALVDAGALDDTFREYTGNGAVPADPATDALAFPA
jgi:hypothetical protein